MSWPAGAWMAAALLVPAALLAGAASADHGGCPLFERLRFDYTVDRGLGGDLFAVEHVVGYTDFRQCYELRTRILKEEVRFESRGGEYELRVIGDDFEHLHYLREPSNATWWYDLPRIESLQYVGLSGHLEPVVETGVTLPVPTPPRLIPRA